MESKMIAVTGATGAQGGAVVKALLKDGSFKIRGVTRNVESEKSLALKSKGVEMVTANYDDQKSLEKAFNGCYGAYLVTNYWEHQSAEKEYNQGKNLVDAAKAVGVQHVIWSTFEDSREFNDDIPFLDDKYKVPHFDAKGDLSEYLDKIGFPTITHLYTSFYMDNLIRIMKVQADKNGVFNIAMPMQNKKLAIVVVDDIGKMAAAAFIKAVAGNLGVASDHLTVSQLADILSKATGKKFVYIDMPVDEYKAVAGGAIANMFDCYAKNEKEFLELRNMEKVKSLITPITIEEFANENKDKFI